MNIFWFRRDLRLEDNAGLNEALSSGKEVLPVFIFDKNIIDELPKNDSRISFIYRLLSDIQRKLHKNGSSLAVFYGEPKEIFERLISENKINAVYTNQDYEPYAIKRDVSIKKLLGSGYF